MRKVKFLGYSFYKSKGEGRLRIHPKSVSKMKAKIKELTSRSNGCGNARRKEALRQYSTGCVNYFKLADMNSLLQRVDEWYRRRLRMVICKQWKRIKTKLVNLVKLGVKKSKACYCTNIERVSKAPPHSAGRNMTLVLQIRRSYVEGVAMKKTT
jgi:hypothetical protein